MPSLFVEIRRQMGSEVFDTFDQAILTRLEESQKKKAAAGQKPPADSGAGPGGSSSKQEEMVCGNTAPKANETESKAETEAVGHKGKIVIDATVTNQAIRYPTDLELLNESREISEKLIDELAKQSGGKKPRTYREQARKRYLNLAKNKRLGKSRAQGRVRFKDQCEPC